MNHGTRRYDFTCRRSNLLALLLLSVLAGGYLFHGTLSGRVWLGDSPPVLSDRVSAVSERIDPNTATAASLQRLPGIGPVKAKAVVDYRQSHGPRPFGSLRELIDKVDGIGEGICRRAHYIDLPAGKTE